VNFKTILLLSLAIPICAPAFAASDTMISSAAPRTGYAAQLGPNARERYREIFAAIHAGQWADATAKLDAMEQGPLHNVIRAELYLAKGSPKVEATALNALIEKAPELPQATQLARLARARGIDAGFAIPSEQELSWLGSAPRRTRLARADDALASMMAARILPLIKDNRPNDAEAIILGNEASLGAESRTEWMQRVAWSYYITGDDEAARRLGARAQQGAGEWTAQADWTVGLTAWRQKDFAAAATAFDSAARRFDDDDMRAAAHFWAARAFMASAEPQKIDAHLKAAARSAETFYGLIALDRLGIKARPADPEGMGSVEKLPNVRAALALAEIGETSLADTFIRHQARIGDARNHAALTVLAGRLELPATQLYLAHNGPAGAVAPITARYPMPKTWIPDGGWRVDKALVFAHALQESQFRTTVVSPAGARGLMQVLPGTAAMIARSKGQELGSLNKPSTNMEYGQSFIERLRDMTETGGFLPKVIAAYNAGPTPIGVWNARTRDNGDPLLYIESIPYWETRAYVTIVLRNYWMYQLEAGDKTTSMAALSQGLWPRFPGLPGKTAVRLDRVGGVASAD
jgi:soluble lytic murein transglycosylase